MQKRVSLFFCLFGFIYAFSQTKTTIYQGRTVNIFPYRIQVDESEAASSINYDDGYYNFKSETVFDNYTIPYCPEKLKDGEYIIYYKPEIELNNYEKSMLQFAKGDTLFVAVNFFIKNGLKDGPVKFYDRNNLKKSIVNGNYLLDFKSNIWKYTDGKGKILSEFLEGKLNGKTTISYKKSRIIKNFKDGFQDGLEQTFNGKKLIDFKTYKNGLLYGLYYKQSYTKVTGFHLNYENDSFTNVYNSKEKLSYSIFNSPTLLPGSDTSEKEWYIDFSNIKKVEGKDYPYSYNTTKIYSHFYSVSAQGKRINDFYLFDKKIKIPFVYLDENEDTLIHTRRIENNDSFLLFNMIVNTYAGKGKLKSKIETEIRANKFYNYEGKIYNIFQNNGNLFNEETKKLETNFNKNYIEKIYPINKPLSQYKGWVIKTDSTVYLNLKTEKPDYFVEHFEIKGINTSFLVYTSYANSFYSSSYPNLEISVEGNDTLVIKEKSEIVKNLNSFYTRKIVMKDSTILNTDNNLLNLNSLVLSDLSGTKFSGISSHVIEYNGKPYTGSLELTLKHSKKIGRYGTKVSLKQKNQTLYLIKWVHKERTFKRILKQGFYGIARLFKFGIWQNIALAEEVVADVVSTTQGNTNVFPPLYRFEYKNGKLHGPQNGYTNNGFELYNLNFKNGVSHGSQWYNISTSDYYNHFNFLSQLNYDSARLDGYIYLLQDEGGQPKLFTNYNKGKLNGNFIQFEDSYHDYYPTPELEASFVNDTLTGKVVASKFGLVNEIIPFKNGKANGKYIKNLIRVVNDNESDSVHNYKSYTVYYKELETKLVDGEIKDSIVGYFENGSVKYIAMVDSDFHHSYIKQNFNPKSNISLTKYKGFFKDTTLEKELNSTRTNYGQSGNEYIEFGIQSYNDDVGLDFDPMYDNPKAEFTFFYKNGLKSQQGKMVNGIKYRTWKYWNENGVLMKEIEYKPGLDSSTENTVYYLGKITAYYPDGKILLKGLITDEELSYQCNQEIEIAYEEVYFLNYYNQSGNQTLNKLSGTVSDYHLSGNKRYSGQITHGAKTGLWKFYDPNGNLKEIGEYADGQKQGKWLEGDLGGVNFLDNACSVNEALSLMKEKKQQDIDVTETLYEMGAIISSSHLVLEKF